MKGKAAWLKPNAPSRPRRLMGDDPDRKAADRLTISAAVWPSHSAPLLHPGQRRGDDPACLEVLLTRALAGPSARHDGDLQARRWMSFRECALRNLWHGVNDSARLRLASKVPLHKAAPVEANLIGDRRWRAMLQRTGPGDAGPPNTKHARSSVYRRSPLCDLKHLRHHRNSTSLALVAARAGYLRRPWPAGRHNARPPCRFLNPCEEEHRGRESVGRGLASALNLPAHTGWTWRVTGAVTIKG